MMTLLIIWLLIQLPLAIFVGKAIHFGMNA